MSIEQPITSAEKAETIPELHPGGPSAAVIPSWEPTISIAIITCSTRPSRIGPFVTKWVSSVIEPALPPIYRLTVIDLANLSPALPFLDEPGIPAQFPKEDPTPHYQHAHSRAWSTEVRRHEAFIFVTPQYNWGYPATVKNALDYLYHEWTGKPAMIVGYGGRGANQARDQLAAVLKGLRMRVVEASPGLKISVAENERTVEEGRFPEGRVELWKGEGVDGEVVKGVGEVVGLLEGR